MSLQDSKDPVEQLYGNHVLRWFPNYEIFWVEFIGNPTAKRAEPYKYVFPHNMHSQEKDRILRGYERIQMVHYSLFCHLAGTHFQLAELENTKNIQDPKERYFRHWEHYEAGYTHLGSVFYMLKGLWKAVLKLRKYPGNLRELKQYLISKEKSELVKKLDEVETAVRIRRDQAVHYGRVFAWLYKDQFYVPLDVHRDMKWSESMKTVEWIRTNARLSEDMIETEKLINGLHTFLISEYRDFINEEKIQIDYGERK